MEKISAWNGRGPSKRDLEAFMAELEKGTKLLSRRDPAIRVLAKKHGLPEIRPHGGYFATLVRSIIFQQISGAAGESIMKKTLVVLGGMLDPTIITQVPDEPLRGAGLSPQKLGYLRSLCQHVLDGRLELPRLPKLSDEEVIRELTDVKGIGVWTAHMFLMFSLGRLDVLPTGDLGVRRGVQHAYALDTMPTPKQVEAIVQEKNWAPYRSIGSWYMWRVVDN